MAKSHQQPPNYTAGDVVKDAVDDRMARGMRGMWKHVQEYATGSFFKGALLTALVVVGVMALVCGFMGSTGSLHIAGQGIMNTFEKGAGAGISKAFQFLASGMGIGTMALGGGLGVASNIIHNQHKQAALESERLALEYQHKREKGKAPEVNQPAPEKQEAKAAPAKPERTTDNSIYVKGSVIKNDKFCAAELKRRTEREMTLERTA